MISITGLTVICFTEEREENHMTYVFTQIIKGLLSNYLLNQE